MDKHLRTRLESCRPGSDDLQAPEMSDVVRHLEADAAARSVYQSLQQWDSKVQGAMEEIPLPPGLADRLLARLRASAPQAALDSTAAAAIAAEQDSPCSPQTVVLQQVVLQHVVDDAVASAGTIDAQTDVEVCPAAATAWPRRRWLAVMATAGVLMAGIVGSFFQPHGDTPLDELVDDWRQGLGNAWQDVRQAPRDAILPATVVASPVGWQKVRGQRGIAYKLMNAQGKIAYLFVVRMSQGNLPLAPPTRPQSTTGGRTLGYWQRGEWVYALLMDAADEQSYRTFVRSGPVPLA